MFLLYEKMTINRMKYVYIILKDPYGTGIAYTESIQFPKGAYSTEIRLKGKGGKITDCGMKKVFCRSRKIHGKDVSGLFLP